MTEPSRLENDAYRVAMAWFLGYEVSAKWVLGPRLRFGRWRYVRRVFDRAREIVEALVPVMVLTAIESGTITAGRIAAGAITADKLDSKPDIRPEVS